MIVTNKRHHIIGAPNGPLNDPKAPQIVCLHKIIKRCSADVVFADRDDVDGQAQNPLSNPLA